MVLKIHTNEKEFDLHTIIFDLNGTLVDGGELDDRVPGLLKKLANKGLRCVLLTGDQRGVAQHFVAYGLEVIVAKNSQEKRDWVVKNTVQGGVVTVGNARIDIGMFEVSDIRIATLQSEGIHTKIISYVDIIVPSIVDAIMLFLDEDRFAATMKI